MLYFIKKKLNKVQYDNFNNNLIIRLRFNDVYVYNDTFTLTWYIYAQKQRLTSSFHFYDENINMFYVKIVLRYK